MAFTNTELTSIVIIFYTASVLNLLGALFTIVTFLIFKEARNTATFLIFSLALADLSSAVGSAYLWTYVVQHENNIYCQMQAGFQMFGLTASVVWGLIIGCYLFLAIYKDVDLEFMGKIKLIILCHLLAWGYASAATIFPYFNNGYGILFPAHEYSWCGIDDPDSPYRALLYVFDSMIFVVLIVFYVLIRDRLRKAHNSAAQVMCKKMNIYLLSYAFINLFAIINRVQNYYSTNQIFELYLLQFLTQPLQGFVNAIAYVWNEPMYIEQYKNLFSRTAQNITIMNETEEERERLQALVNYDLESCELVATYGSINDT